MKVTLKKPHRHAGKDSKPGDTIDISDQQATWLAEQGVIEPPAAEAVPAETSTKTKKGD